MKTKRFLVVLAALLGVALTANLHAQLVADGGTLNFTGSTTLAGDLIVGTNGGNTMLNIIAPGTVTNATGTIGLNASSTNNQVRVQNNGAVWQNNGDLNVGFDSSGNQLVVSNGGLVANTGDGYVGWRQATSNNLAVVTGTGSLWTNGGDLYIGNRGSGNHLVVSNGAALTSASSSLGYNALANNNLVTVTGTNSQWRVSYDLIVGYDNNTNNQLVIRDGGVVVSSSGSIGSGASGGNMNMVLVADPGSLWSDSTYLYVGEFGSASQLIITNGGTVQATNAIVGYSVSSTNNRVLVNEGNLIVTNAGGTGTLDIRRGTNVLNAGLVVAEELLLTNSAGFFDFNGGTLITGGGTVSNGQRFVVGASGTTAGIFDVRSGAPLTLNNGFTLGANTAAAGNQLLVTNGGTLSVTGTSYVCTDATASNNLAVVSGPNSLWTNSGFLLVGLFGSANQLVVSNGGTVANTIGSVGDKVGANNNLAVVTGAGSVWTNSGSFAVGYNGSGNQLVVSNGGLVANTYCNVGNTAIANSNLVVVTGPGSLWINSGNLYVGNYGSGNQLMVSDDGTVQAPNAYVGFQTGSTNNRAMVDGGNMIVTNSGGTAVLDIRRGTNVLNTGVIQADKLLVTNGALSGFEFNGGTLITGGGTVDNGQPFVVGASGTTAAILDVWSNAPLVLNNDLTLGASTAAGNQLLLTNGGTLSVTGTSYVGVDAAASNNLVTISGSNSLWTNSSEFYFGYFSSGNQLVVSNGGALADGFAYIGLASSSSNNVAVVTGEGSTWTNTGDLRVGGFGSGNQLVVTDGGAVVSGTGYFAANSGESSNNLAIVTGPNSRWILNSILNMGYLGGGNRLVVSNGGTVQAVSAYVGVNSGSTDNRVTVHGGNLIVTNSAGTAVLDIRRGTNVLNAGLIQTDNLLLNNGTGFFEFKGGTLSVNNSAVENGLPFVVGNGPPAATYQLSGNGLHTFNNGLVISALATLTGNGTVVGPLTVQSGGNLSPSAPLGLLALNNSPVLQGTVLMQISKKGLNRTNNQIQVAAPLTYGGNLIVSGLGLNELTVGDSFPLFSASSYGGAFTSVILPPLDPSLMWTNKLLLDGSIAVVQRPPPTISGVVQSGTNLVFNVSEGSPGGAYTLLTSTNVTLPLSAWATNSTGSFDVFGGITIIRGINPAETQRYYKVRVP